MTGSELLERVAVLRPDTERMIVTAYADMDAVMQAVNRGQVSRYYYKPWVREELVRAIAAVEVLYREDFETDALVPCVISSVTAYSIFTGIFGFQPIFHPEGT